MTQPASDPIAAIEALSNKYHQLLAQRDFELRTTHRSWGDTDRAIQNISPQYIAALEAAMRSLTEQWDAAEAENARLRDERGDEPAM